LDKNKLNKILFFLQPLLIALYPAFFLYSRSVGEAYFYEFALLFCGIFVVTFLFNLLLSFIFKSSLKASVFITIFYVGSFLLPIVYSKLDEVTFWGIRFFKLRYFLLIFFIFLIFLFFKILKLKKLKNIWGKFLVLPFTLLIVFSVFNLFISLNQINQLVNVYKKENKEFLLNNKQKLKSPERIDYLPDIYFIILDCYPSEKSLKKFYNYHNSDFIEKLKKLGFYITNDSMSNYPVTVRSIPSTLNMNYNSYLKPNDMSHGLAYYMMNNNNVMYYLKQLGYEFYNINSSWGPSKKLTNSNFKNKYIIPSEFIKHYFSMTILGLLSRYFFEKSKYNLILKQLGVLKELKKYKRSKFIFVHIHSPHSPFIFNKSGKFVCFKWPSDTKSYLEQLNYISYHSLEKLAFLINSYDRKPIIVLQSDHGAQNYVSVLKNDLNFQEKCLLNYGNLSAFYLPGINENELPKNVSPVNNFRFIFNKYFGTNFEILENKQF
jgi:hypothetical protein